MAKFTANKSVEAHQFVVTDDQKKEFDKKEPGQVKRPVVHSEVSEPLKKDSEGFFAVVSVQGNATIVRDGDYLIREDGKIVSVVSKEQFESEHKAEVEEAPIVEVKEDETPAA